MRIQRNEAGVQVRQQSADAVGEGEAGRAVYDERARKAQLVELCRETGEGVVAKHDSGRYGLELGDERTGWTAVRARGR